MKRLVRFAIDFVLGSACAICLLSIGAELERREDAELRAIAKQHQVAPQIKEE